MSDEDKSKDAGADNDKKQDDAGQGQKKDPPANSGAVDYSKDDWLSSLPADAQAYVKRLRGEASSHRKEASALEKQLKEYKDKESEAERKRLEEEGKYKELAEKLQRERDEEKKQYEDRLIRSEVRSRALAAGVVSARVADLIPRDKIKFDENGEMVGIEEAIADFREAEPSLFKSEAAGEQKTGDAKKEVKSTGSDKADPNPAAKAPPFSALNLSQEEWKKKREELLSKRA